LLVELADRLGLTSTLDWRAPQGRRRHPDAQVLRDLDRGAAPGEPLAGILWPGNAPAGASDDLIELVGLAVAQLPAAASGEQPVLVRSDSAGGNTKLAWHLRDHGIRFSLGM
jgi:hypothetical protein